MPELHTTAIYCTTVYTVLLNTDDIVATSALDMTTGCTQLPVLGIVCMIIGAVYSVVQ